MSGRAVSGRAVSALPRPAAFAAVPPTLAPAAMRPFRRLVAAVATTTLLAGAGTAAAQDTRITFDAVPTATAAGAFATASGYTFANLSTLEAASAFGTGANAVGGTGRFAYVPLAQGFGSVRREDTTWNLLSAFLSFRAFDGNTAPVSVTVNGYRGLDPAAPAVFTRVLTLTNSAQRFDFGFGNVSEVEFLTGGLELGGRRAMLAIDDLSVTVPEPATVALVGAGLVLVLGAARRRVA